MNLNIALRFKLSPLVESTTKPYFFALLLAAVSTLGLLDPRTVHAEFSIPDLLWRCHVKTQQVYRKFTGKRITLEETKTRISNVENSEYWIGAQVFLKSEPLSDGRKWVVSNFNDWGTPPFFEARTEGKWEDLIDLPDGTHVSGLGNEFKIISKDGKRFEYIANFNKRNQSMTSPYRLEEMLEQAKKGENRLFPITVEKPGGPRVTYVRSEDPRFPLLKIASVDYRQSTLFKQPGFMTESQFWSRYKNLSSHEIYSRSISRRYPNAQLKLVGYDEKTGNVILEHTVILNGQIAHRFRIEKFENYGFTLDELERIGNSWSKPELASQSSGTFHLTRFWKNHHGGYQVILARVSNPDDTRMLSVLTDKKPSILTKEGFAVEAGEAPKLDQIVSIEGIDYKIAGISNVFEKSPSLILKRIEQIEVPIEQFETAVSLGRASRLSDDQAH